MAVRIANINWGGYKYLTKCGNISDYIHIQLKLNAYCISEIADATTSESHLFNLIIVSNLLFIINEPHNICILWRKSSFSPLIHKIDIFREVCIKCMQRFFSIYLQLHRKEKSLALFLMSSMECVHSLLYDVGVVFCSFAILENFNWNISNAKCQTSIQRTLSQLFIPICATTQHIFYYHHLE